MPLIVKGSTPASVFHLIGTDENSATYALGWTLEKSPAMLRAFIEELKGNASNAEHAVLTLQKHGDDGGFTDIEIHSGSAFHAIVEAKKGWLVPGLEQLSRYRPRLVGKAAVRQCLVSLSSVHADIAKRTLPASVDGVEVLHLSWRDIQRMANRAHAKASGFQEKLWLSQLGQHMKEFTAMERMTDNTVYVVSLGTGPMVDGKARTWIDVVEKERSYFHPVGRTWPTQPPNYVGFRYHGKLQSVHHVDSFDIMADVSERNPEWIKTDIDHFVYKLGPPMAPAKEVRSGNIHNRRLSCAIDTLLSGAFETIGAASEETKRRLADEA